jgi:hypothetical protein
MGDDFGVIVTACDHDYVFATGCCATIRHFLGDVPICLLLDGTVSTHALEDAYGVRVITKRQVSSPLLRDRSFGFGLTKMISFWESPWEHFLHIDGDAVVWGDVLKHAHFGAFDVVTDLPRYSRSDEAIARSFFHLGNMERQFPDFDWRAHRDHFFCTGTFFARRGIFELEEYEAILDLTSQFPHLFLSGEQGLLNFMLCHAEEAGRIRIGRSPLQFLVPDHTLEEARSRFPMDGVDGPANRAEDVIIHWAGPNKPTFWSRQVYSEPMTFARQKFLRDMGRSSHGGLNLALTLQDWMSQYYRNRGRVARRVRALRGLPRVGRS